MKIENLQTLIPLTPLCGYSKFVEKQMSKGNCMLLLCLDFFLINFLQLISIL